MRIKNWSIFDDISVTVLFGIIRVFYMYNTVFIYISDQTCQYAMIWTNYLLLLHISGRPSLLKIIGRAPY